MTATGTRSGALAILSAGVSRPERPALQSKTLGGGARPFGAPCAIVGGAV
jgi:hypothetical protein